MFELDKEVCLKKRLARRNESNAYVTEDGGQRSQEYAVIYTKYVVASLGLSKYSFLHTALNYP